MLIFVQKIRKNVMLCCSFASKARKFSNTLKEIYNQNVRIILKLSLLNSLPSCKVDCYLCFYVFCNAWFPHATLKYHAQQLPWHVEITLHPCNCRLETTLFVQRNNKWYVQFEINSKQKGVKCLNFTGHAAIKIWSRCI